MLAKYDVFPELNHNEALGWEGPSPPNVHVVLFRGKGEKEEVAASVEYLKQYLQGKTGISEIFAQGDSQLEQMVYLTLLGDLTSYYAAKQAGIDPKAMEYINNLKMIIKE